MTGRIEFMGKSVEGTPHYQHELASGGTVCGIDEAGRGPLAGPVVAAAVTLNPNAIPTGLNDSKQLGKAVRERLAEVILATSDVGVGIANVQEIDQLNILHATMLAMQRAYDSLNAPTTYALIDGNRAPVLPCTSFALVKGDRISVSIAAASIIAKVTRDRIMEQLHQEYPQYHFARNAGYGTRHHLAAMAQYGVTSHHRRSFRPVRKCLG
jgi:ribonuclease HII